MGINYVDTYHLAGASEVSKESPDPVTQVGAIIATESGSVLAGWNNLCSYEDDPRMWKKDVKHLRVIHAEVDAIGVAAKEGIRIGGSTMYCTLFPCLNCALSIIASGITKVVAQKAHYALNDPRFYEPLRRFEECGIEVVLIEYPKHDEV